MLNGAELHFPVLYKVVCASSCMSPLAQMACSCCMSLWNESLPKGLCILICCWICACLSHIKSSCTRCISPMPVRHCMRCPACIKGHSKPHTSIIGCCMNLICLPSRWNSLSFGLNLSAAGLWSQSLERGRQLVATLHPHLVDDLRPHIPALVVHGAAAAADWPGGQCRSHDSHVLEVNHFHHYYHYHYHYHYCRLHRTRPGKRKQLDASCYERAVLVAQQPKKEFLCLGMCDVICNISIIIIIILTCYGCKTGCTVYIFLLWRSSCHAWSNARSISACGRHAIAQELSTCTGTPP